MEGGVPVPEFGNFQSQWLAEAREMLDRCSFTASPRSTWLFLYGGLSRLLLCVRANYRFRAKIRQ